jgi:uncharacterized protein (TIGR00255 family)
MNSAPHTSYSGAREGGRVAIYSMTGFARAAVPDTVEGWAWEVRSVNGRGLDVRCRLPGGLDQLEIAVRAAVAKRMTRGNVTVSLSGAAAETGQRIRLNRAALDDVLAIIKEIQDKVEAAPPRLDGLLALRGVIETGEGRAAPDEPALLKTMDEALVALAKVRETEGRALQREIVAHLDEIDSLTRSAAACAGAQPAAIKARLAAQIAELLGGTSALPPDRLAQEAALLAAKADIREEIGRLDAHVTAARALLKDGGAVGRRLDFLSQEFNREANTLCSKSSDIELTRIGLALKASIDRLREQAANIE